MFVLAVTMNAKHSATLENKLTRVDDGPGFLATAPVQRATADDDRPNLFLNVVDDLVTGAKFEMRCFPLRL